MPIDFSEWGLRITKPNGISDLELDGIEGEEHIAQLFRFQLEVHSSDSENIASALLGAHVNVASILRVRRERDISMAISPGASPSATTTRVLNTTKRNWSPGSGSSASIPTAERSRT